LYKNRHTDQWNKRLEISPQNFIHLILDNDAKNIQWKKVPLPSGAGKPQFFKKFYPQQCIINIYQGNLQWLLMGTWFLLGGVNMFWN
jgi:hypothetical protein